MKTQEEILKQIASRRQDDLLGFEVGEYLEALTKENIKLAVPSIKDSDLETWVPKYTTDEEVLACAKDYLEFAYSKINGRRGISAERSVMHYIGWMWLVDSPLYEEIKEMYEKEYRAYGRAIINRVVAFYGWEKPYNVDFGAWEIAATARSIVEQYASFPLTHELHCVPTGWAVHKYYNESRGGADATEVFPDMSAALDAYKKLTEWDESSEVSAPAKND